MCFDIRTVNLSRAKIDTALYKEYNKNDNRKLAFFTDYSGYQKFKGNYTQDDYYIFTGIATDEILLIRAEASARKGRLAEALQDINLLLRKRYNTNFTDIVVTTSQQVLQIILLERRKELVCRGLRFPDIKRLNKEGLVIVPTRLIHGEIYKLPPNDYRYALPIPKVVLDESGMKQNEY